MVLFSYVDEEVWEYYGIMGFKTNGGGNRVMEAVNNDQLIYALTLAIESKFDQSDWTKLAYEIDEVDTILEHSRLLRSLSWNDPDYTQNIIGVLEDIREPSKLEEIAKIINLEEWLVLHREDLYKKLYVEDEPEYVIEENPLDNNKFDLAKQLKRIYSSLDDDPELALGTTKEMLETVMKTILDGKVENLNKMDIPELIKEVRKELTLIPDVSEESKKAKKTLERTLSNLGQIIVGIGELRNTFGTGHGKVINESNLKGYHTRFAVNSGITLAKFLMEVYEDEEQ